MKGAKHGGTARQRRAERAYKACEQCVRSKDKCDNSRPCKRCQKKSLLCTTIESKSRFSAPLSDSHEATFRSDPEQFQARSDAPNSVDEMQLDQRIVTTDQSMDTHILQEAFENQSSVRGAFDIPPFFEHIMVSEPDWMSGSYIQPPADLAAWLQDNDWFDNGDLFATDFPIIDQTFEATYTPATAEAHGIGAVDPASTKEHEAEDARRRHVAFQQSPWY